MHISFSEILVILLVALLVIRPEQLPDAAMRIARFVKWFRHTTDKIKQEMAEPLKQLTTTSSSLKPSLETEKKIEP